MITKTCKQCGKIKPQEQFRKYYGGRKGSYNTCKVCEKINSRYKYIEAKEPDTRSEQEAKELQDIETLYGLQRKMGLQPPRATVRNKSDILEDIGGMITEYKEALDKVPEAVPASIPGELLTWLRADMTEEPEYYLDEVYEELKKKYRPTVCINPISLLPEYDDTYKTILDQILDRFSLYEDEYYTHARYDK